MNAGRLDGKRVLVFGASGTQGSAVSRSLARAGAIVRGASKHGVHTAVGLPVKVDLMSRTTATSDELAGVHAVFLHVPLSFGAPGDAAKVASHVGVLAGCVDRIVFSSSGPLPDSPVGVPFVDERLALATAVLATGKGVVLRATGFLENFSASWSAPSVVAGELIYPVIPSALGRWVSNRDVGRAVVRALLEEGAVGDVFTLAGPELLTMADLAARIGEAIGRSVRFRRVSGEEYGRMLAPVLGPEIAAMIGAAYDSMPEGNPAFAADGTEAARVLGYRQTTVLDWARTETWCP